MDRQTMQPTGTSPSWSGGFRRRVPFYILLAVLFSLVSGVLTYLYLKDIRSRALPALSVVIAEREIRPGTPILSDQVALSAVPAGIVPSNSFFEVEQVLGRSAVSTIQKKQVILLSDLVGGESAGLSDRLPDGRWAMVLPASWLVSPVPALDTGDTLDLMAYLGGEPRDQMGLIVSAVECIRLSSGSERPDYLTLAVSKEQAEAILFARTNGYSLLVLLRPTRG